MRGLQSKFVKEAGGDFKKAWALQRAASGKKHHHEQHTQPHTFRETVVPTRDGGAITSRSMGGLSARISAHTVVEYDEEQLGMILRGFISGMREPVGPDLSSMFPPPESEVDSRTWREGAQERELGREVFKRMGKALLFFKVPREEWVLAYDIAIRQVFPTGMLPSTPPTSTPPALPLPGGVTAPQGAWLTPLSVPSAVTSAFDASEPARGGEFHRGIDLRAADGTPVVAPTRMMIRKVFEEQEGGLVIKAAAQRPDGVFPDITYNSQDDTGFILTFAHLQRALVSEGAVVEPGQQIAESGHSGSAQNGPHLHFTVEYVIDRTFPFSDLRIWVNPEALIPRDLLEGRGAARVPQANTATSALIMPKTDQAADLLGTPSTKIGQVVFNGDGTLVVNGQAVPVNLKPVLKVTTMGGFGAGGDLAFPSELLPPQVRSVATDLTTMGRRVVSGVGDLAGHAFEVITSKDGLVGLSNLVNVGANALAAALGIGGPIAGMVGPALAAVPYAGPFLAGAAEIAAPIATVAAPIVGAFGNLAGAGARVMSPGNEVSSAELASHLGFNNGPANVRS